jgi:hypothetical protein
MSRASKPRPWRRVADYVRRDYPDAGEIAVIVTCCRARRTFATAAICVPVAPDNAPIYHCGECLFSALGARLALVKALS